MRCTNTVLKNKLSISNWCIITKYLRCQIQVQRVKIRPQFEIRNKQHRWVRSLFLSNSKVLFITLIWIWIKWKTCHFLCSVYFYHKLQFGMVKKNLEVSTCSLSFFTTCCLLWRLLPEFIKLWLQLQRKKKMGREVASLSKKLTGVQYCTYVKLLLLEYCPLWSKYLNSRLKCCCLRLHAKTIARNHLQIETSARMSFESTIVCKASSWPASETI